MRWFTRQRTNSAFFGIALGLLFLLSCNTINSTVAGNQTPDNPEPSNDSFTELTESASPAITGIPSAGRDTLPNRKIGLLQTGGHYPYTFRRLTALGYSVELLPPDSGLDSFLRYRIIYLSTAWADQYYDADFQIIEARAEDYHAYLRGGGCMLVEQPNPFQRQDGLVTPAILPYPITFDFSYDDEDWPPVIVIPDHFITEGLEGKDMPGPGDRIVDIDPAYTILVRGRSTNSPSLAVAAVGNGRILILADTSIPGSRHHFGDLVYRRMIEWLLGP